MVDLRSPIDQASPSSLSEGLSGICLPSSSSSNPKLLQSLGLLNPLPFLGSQTFATTSPSFRFHIGRFFPIAPKKTRKDEETYEERKGERYGKNHSRSTLKRFWYRLPPWRKLKIIGRRVRMGHIIYRKKGEVVPNTRLGLWRWSAGLRIFNETDCLMP